VPRHFARRDDGLTLEVVSSLSRVAAAEWNALIEDDDPFTQHGFLHLLERSGSVGAGTGWAPCHVLLRRDGALQGALPLYLKQHSYGEFIFDFGWAHAAQRAGLRYYPKLVSAVPFTPAGGPRLLFAPGVDRSACAGALIGAARALLGELSASSLHVLFCSAEQAQLLAAQGLHVRRSLQYHLSPEPPLGGFADYQAALRHSARKQVRREREQARSYGLSLSMRPFAELAAADVEAMWTFYNATIDQHGSSAYLTRAFFAGLPESPHAYAAMAHDAGEPVAGALFFANARAVRPLLGRRARAAHAAFRALLLPAHRVGAGARHPPLRGGRSGRAQDQARLSAGDLLQRALGGASGARPRHRRVRARRGAGGGGRHGAAGDAHAVQARRRVRSGGYSDSSKLSGGGGMELMDALE
jgi:predicted N-acyltransferase